MPIHPANKGSQFTQVESLDDIQAGDVLRVSHPQRTGGRVVATTVESYKDSDYEDATPYLRAKVRPEKPEGDWDFTEINFPLTYDTGYTFHSVRRPV